MIGGEEKEKKRKGKKKSEGDSRVEEVDDERKKRGEPAFFLSLPLLFPSQRFLPLPHFLWVSKLFELAKPAPLSLSLPFFPLVDATPREDPPPFKMPSGADFGITLVRFLCCFFCFDDRRENEKNKTDACRFSDRAGSSS